MRFVLHHHTGWPRRSDHYDLMLEKGASPAGGSPDSRPLFTLATEADKMPARGVLLRRIGDHRAEYLTFEGEVSGGRGRVSRVDAGELAWLSSTDDPTEELRFRLDGKRLKGEFVLRPAGDGAFEMVRLPER